MQAAEVLQIALDQARLGVPELARRAGVGRSSLYRYLEGTQAPTFDTIDDILALAGLEARVSIEPLSDPSAGTAVRAMVDGASPVEAGSDAVLRWRDRLQRVATTDVRGALLLGGTVASVLRRPDTLGFISTDWTIDRLVSAGRASSSDWALSGGAALDALGHDLEAPTILWTGEPRRLSQLLADTFSSVPLERAELLVCRADDSVLGGVTTVEDVRLVAPVQAYVDALGLGGAAETLALDALEEASK